MHISLWFIFIALLLVATMLVLTYRRRRKHRAGQVAYEKPFHDWLKNTKEASTLVEKLELGPPPEETRNGPHSLPKDLSREVRKAYYAISGKAEQDIADIARTVQLRNASELASMIQQTRFILSESWIIEQITHYCDQLHGAFSDLTSYDIDWLKELRKETTESWTSSKLAEARTLDRDAFIELRKFVGDSHPNYRSEYGRITGHGFAFPSDWDDLMIHFFRNPCLDDFLDAPDLAPGRVSLLAARALREQSLMDGLLVRAYCRSQADIRREVGDVLFADVTKMVERLQNAGRFVFS